ncbi:hypothetical protein D3C86_1719250 [compost metagenome]
MLHLVDDQQRLAVTEYPETLKELDQVHPPLLRQFGLHRHSVSAGAGLHRLDDRARSHKLQPVASQEPGTVNGFIQRTSNHPLRVRLVKPQVCRGNDKAVCLGNRYQVVDEERGFALSPRCEYSRGILQTRLERGQDSFGQVGAGEEQRVLGFWGHYGPLCRNS